jgi:L-asparagine oxygenase
VIPASLRDEIERNGYWLGRAPSTASLTATAAALGEPVSVRSGSDIVHDLRPLAPEHAPKKSLSAVHGEGAFPFHTDGAHHRTPPRWVVMRCVAPGNGDRPTLLLDATQLKLTTAEWRLLERSVWWVSSGGRSFPVSIVQSNDFGRTFRYDAGCMKPAARGFQESRRVLEEAIGDTSSTAIAWDANDLLIFDNWRMLHSRAAGQSDDRGVRHLQRVLVR